MARTAKKEAALTPEEKLTSVLVPTNEQEYQIPNNWSWIILGELVGIKRGASPRPIKSYITEDENGINWIKIGDTDSGKYVTHIKEKVTVDGAKKSVFVKKGTLLLSNSMSFGRPYILNVDGCIHDGWLAITPNEAVDKEYLYYAFLASEWYFERVAVGTAVRNLNSDRVAATPIPLPPLAEQQRIVDRIEILFAKLDEAKGKAQIVVDGFEDRKAAILHKAFTGELTAEWRKRNSVDFDSSWRDCTLGDFANSQYGYTEKSSSEKIGPKFLRITDIQDGQVVWTDVPYCKIDDEVKGKYSLAVGDIVVARTGATTGKSYMVIDEVDAVYASYLIRVSIQKKESLRSKFLYYFLQCPLYWQQITELSSGIAQPGVNGNKLKTLCLPIPDVQEQDEIVKCLDYILPIERQARDSAELVLEQIDTMKKSILARAFRGELGTNDPNDESAVELLKRVLRESV